MNRSKLLKEMFQKRLPKLLFTDEDWHETSIFYFFTSLPVKKAFVHTGFWRRFSSICPQIFIGYCLMLCYIYADELTAEDKHVPKDVSYTSALNVPIICTGHSLGGAIAQLCAVFLIWFFERPSVKLVTWESPRVFKRVSHEALCRASQAFRTLDDTGVRYVNANDAVTGVPLYPTWYHWGKNVFHLGTKDSLISSVANWFNPWSRFVSSHFRDNLKSELDRYFPKGESGKRQLDPSAPVRVTIGHGRIAGKRRRSKTRSRPSLPYLSSQIKGSREAKLYMAWVRSHKRVKHPFHMKNHP